MLKEKKVAARRCRELWQSISERESDFKRRLREYGKAADELLGCQLKYNKADIRYMKKENSRTARDLEMAQQLLSLCRGEYKSAREQLLNIKGQISAKYESLVALASEVSDREWDKARGAFERFERDAQEKISRADKGACHVLADLAEESADTPVSRFSEPEAQVEQQRREGGVALETDFLLKNPEAGRPTAPTAPSAGVGVNAIGVTSVNIAPINIDVTAIVSKAVEATVEKLQASLDGKLSAYVESLDLPEQREVNSAPFAASRAPAGPTDTEREQALALAREEARVYGELQAISESLKELRKEIETATEALASAAKAQSLIAEEQKRTAEAQTETAEAQKKITEAQTETAEAQKKITEAQTETAEAQRRIALEQKETADIQKKTVRLQQGVRISQRLLDEESAQGKLLVKKEENPDA